MIRYRYFINNDVTIRFLYCYFLGISPMKKIFLSMAICIGLTACGGDKPASTETQKPASTDVKTEAKADEFKSKLPDNAPVVKVVTSGVLPPFTFQDNYGNLQGIDIDVIRAIGEDQGFKVELYKEPFVEMFPKLEKGAYQVIISDLSLTEERAAKYGHTNSYLFNPSIIMYKPELNLTSPNDLKGLRVATMSDTKQELMVNKIATQQHDKLNTVFALYQGLMQNKYDAVLQDKYLLEYISSNHPQYKVKTLEYEPDTEPSTKLVMYTRKNDQELIGKLNKGIDNLKKNGEIEKIKDKYIKKAQ